MKIQTSKIKTALENLQRIAGRKVTVPILSHVKMEASSGWLTLTASNLDEYQTERVECDGDLDCCCPNLRYLQGALGGDELELTLTLDVLRVEWNENKFDLKTLPAAEFPAEPTDKFKAFGVPCDALAKGINAVIWAASTDPARYLYNSVHVVSHSKLLRCDATTGRELARWEIELISVEFDALIPSGFAANTAFALEREESVFFLGERQIKVEHLRGTYSCKLVDGVYGNVEAVIPKELENIGTSQLAPLVEAFSRCNFFTNPIMSPGAIVGFSKRGCSIDFIGASELSLTVLGKFEKDEIQVNAESFHNCLSNLEGDEVKIFIGAGKREDLHRHVMLSAGNLRVIMTQMIGGNGKGKE